MIPLSKPNLLVIDDEDSMLKTYKSILKDEYCPVLANSGQLALELLPQKQFALVLLDYMMPGMDGLETFKKIKEFDPDLEVIMVTAVKDIKFAVQAIKTGAYDYITKPFEIEELMKVIRNVLEKQNLIKENLYLKEIVNETYINYDLIGRSPQIKELLSQINSIGATESTVLITGESGTGKEVVAKAIHKASDRASGPFVAINCAAVPENLIESEFFGYERGAFTSALERRIGKFELADGGTIFLDEIGCMPPQLQSRLLRVIENKSFERIGGNKTISVDIRIVSATNIDILNAIKDGEFREDLYYRLNVIPVQLSPLRERKEDIPLFVEYFLAKFNRELNKKIQGFTSEALNTLVEYNWPGNVRELQNLIERLVALSQNQKLLGKEDLPLVNCPQNPGKQTLKSAIDVFERKYIEDVLEQTQGNQTEAAQILGIHRTTLINKMNSLGITNKS